MCVVEEREPREEVEKEWGREGARHRGGAGDGEGSPDRGFGGRTEGGGSSSYLEDKEHELECS